MNHWRNSISIKLAAWLILGLMAINPAPALQYQHFNQTTDFIGKIPDYSPKAVHIHISQKDDVLALLAKQGYEVIPASQADAQHFLASNTFNDTQALRLAANTEIEKPPEDPCAKRAKDKDCPAECSDEDQGNDKNCPLACLDPDRDKEQACQGDNCDKKPKPVENECTAADPVARAKDRKPAPEPEVARPTPRTRATVSINQDFRLPKFSGGGNKGDAAAVMLIVIGVVVVAALFIYAGKWIVDLVSNDEDYYAYWWDIGTQFITLDTGAGQHGNFTGVKFSGGFVPNRVTQFGLAAEVGRMDLDLLYNRNSTPQRLNLAGTYWLLGPTVRWLLGYTDTEQLINNSYVYLNFLGGGSDRDEVDIIAVARIGFNTGLDEHLRLGIHYGAFYLGLDEDQGFVNDGDNYWNMYGLEIGYQF